MPRMPAIHRHKSGQWRCRINGKEHWLGTVKVQAQRKFRVLMAGYEPAIAQPVFVASLVKAWLDLNPGVDHETRLADFSKHSGKLALVDVGKATLVNYHKRLIKRGLAPKTIIDRMRIARRVLVWAVDQEWLSILPTMPKLTRAVRKARDVDPAKLRAALETMKPQGRRILEFILHTGCRPGEAASLKWSDVDMRRDVAIITAHKTAHSTGLQRTIYLTPGAKTILKSIKGRKGFVFLSRLGKPYTVWGLRSAMRRQGLTTYQLRHTFAQNASEQIPEAELSKLLGHTDPSMTRFYYQVRDQRARKAAQSLKSAIG